MAFSPLTTASREKHLEHFQIAVRTGAIKELIGLIFQWSKLREGKADEPIDMPIADQINRIKDNRSGLIYYIEDFKIKCTPIQVFDHNSLYGTPNKK